MNNTFGCFVMGTIYCDKGYFLVIHYEKNVSLLNLHAHDKIKIFINSRQITILEKLLPNILILCSKLKM